MSVVFFFNVKNILQKMYYILQLWKHIFLYLRNINFIETFLPFTNQFHENEEVLGSACKYFFLKCMFTCYSISIRQIYVIFLLTPLNILEKCLGIQFVSLFFPCFAYRKYSQILIKFVYVGLKHRWSS